MYAIEFSTNIKNGKIFIPEEYKQKVNGRARVILLTEDSNRGFDMIDFLLNNPIPVDEFKPFTREEIYE